MARSGIHIDPANRGKFSARAKAHGRSVQEQAKKDAGGASGELQRKRAQFALNARKWAKARRSRRSTRR